MKIRLIFSLLFLFSSLPSLAADTVYTFGIVPQQSAKRLAQLWNPILQHLQAETGLQFQFKTAKNIPEFEKKLAAGEYDFAYMNPYHFTVFNRSPGYQAVAVRKDQPIRGIMVVHKDTSIKHLEDLKDQSLAFPSPAAFAASLLTRAKLTNDGIAFTPKYVSSHDSVYMGVARGIFASGGGVMRTLNNTDPTVREQLKVLWKTDPYTPHAIASHPDMDKNTAQKVQSALVSMFDDDRGKILLQSLKIKKGLIPAENSDWDDVKGLGVDLLENLVEQ